MGGKSSCNCSNGRSGNCGCMLCSDRIDWLTLGGCTAITDGIPIGIWGPPTRNKQYPYSWNVKNYMIPFLSGLWFISWNWNSLPGICWPNICCWSNPYWGGNPKCPGASWGWASPLICWWANKSSGWACGVICGKPKYDNKNKSKRHLFENIFALKQVIQI